MANDELSDLRAARAGDWDATARLLVRASGQLAKRVAHRVDLNPFLPFSTDDVLQEVFIDVFRGITGCLAEEERSFVAWLNQVCDHRLSQMIREQGAIKRGAETKTVRGVDDALRSSMAMLVARLADYRFDMPSEAFARDEAIRAVVDGLSQLPDDQQAAIRLHYLDGRSLDSTATELQRTDGAIRGLLHRAKASLRRSLGNSSRWFRRR